MAAEITRKEFSASDLRRSATRAKNARASRRMLALALVLDRFARGDRSPVLSARRVQPVQRSPCPMRTPKR